MKRLLWLLLTLVSLSVSAQSADKLYEEGKKAYDAKRPSLKAEIEAKAKEHEKLANNIAEGKKEFDAKKPELFKEIQKKVENK